MTEKLGHEHAEIGVRLLGQAYIAWFDAESDCQRALSAWCDAASGNSTEAYLTYRAALDREEAAARDLQRLLQLSQPCSGSLAIRDNAKTAQPRRGQP